MQSPIRLLHMWSLLKLFYFIYYLPPWRLAAGYTYNNGGIPDTADLKRRGPCWVKSSSILPTEYTAVQTLHSDDLASYLLF